MSHSKGVSGNPASANETSVAANKKNLELREAYHRLRKSERLKKDLTDMVVHDMRVPLTAVMGAIETLAEMMKTKLNPQEEELLKMALSSGHALLQMINDLLDISRLEEHKTTLKKHPTKVNLLVAQAVGQVDILAKRKELELCIEIPSKLPNVPMDKDRMVRVLVNLLGNAVQHTPTNGRIVISAACDWDGRTASISVSDTGEGIPKEYHSKIFDKFVQAESHKSRKRTSTGLGLTFCKLVTEAHGGRIWVDSAPGVGSTFSFTLPLE